MMRLVDKWPAAAGAAWSRAGSVSQSTRAEAAAATAGGLGQKQTPRRRRLALIRRHRSASRRALGLLFSPARNSVRSGHDAENGLCSISKSKAAWQSERKERGEDQGKEGIRLRGGSLK